MRKRKEGRKKEREKKEKRKEKKEKKKKKKRKKKKKKKVPVNPIILPMLKGNLDNQETDPPSMGRPTLPELTEMFVFSVPMERGDIRANPTPAPERKGKEGGKNK